MKATLSVSLSGTSKEYIRRLRQAALHHRAVNHPYLQALSSAALPHHATAVTEFAEQYANYSGIFSQMLQTLEPALISEAHRGVIAENLSEESGHYNFETLETLADLGIKPQFFDGVPHHNLFMRFTRAVGGQPQPPSEPMRTWCESMLKMMAEPGGHAGVGALGLGTELIVPQIYRAIESALTYLPHLSTRDTVFFTLHGPVDSHHQEELIELATELAATPSDRRRIARGTFEALDHRALFWDWLNQRANVYLDKVAT